MCSICLRIFIDEIFKKYKIGAKINNIIVFHEFTPSFFYKNLGRDEFRKQWNLLAHWSIQWPQYIYLWRLRYRSLKKIKFIYGVHLAWLPCCSLYSIIEQPLLKIKQKSIFIHLHYSSWTVFYFRSNKKYFVITKN